MIKKNPNSLEYIFTIASLILYTRGVVYVISGDGFSEGDDDSYFQNSSDASEFIIPKVMYFLTYLTSFLFLIRKDPSNVRISRILSHNLCTSLLLGLTFISSMWSESSSLTISRSIALLGTTIFGIYLGVRYSPREQINLLEYTFLTSLGLSIIFAIFLPKYGIMGGVHDGAWRGIYDHKNGLSSSMVLGSLVFILQPKRNINSELLRIKSELFAKLGQTFPVEFRHDSIFKTLSIYVGLSGSIVLLILSRCSSGIIELIIMVMILIFLKTWQLPSTNKFFVRLGLAVTIGIFGVVIAPKPDLIFTSLGKSSDLTGRGDLWKILLDILSENPLFGFGYGAFWDKYRFAVVIEPSWTHAHNGFLEISLGVGLLGLVLFAIGYLYTFFKIFTRFCDIPSDERIYQLILLIYIIISNITEIGLFEYNSIAWPMYLMVSYSELNQSLKPTLMLPSISSCRG